MSMNIGQAAIDSIVVIGKSLVIQAEKVEDGGMKVMRSGNVLDGFETEFVCTAVGYARLDARSRKPTRKAMRIVVAPVGAHLEHRHTSKLGREDD